jgi:hypothetical protein
MVKWDEVYHTTKSSRMIAAYKVEVDARRYWELCSKLRSYAFLGEHLGSVSEVYSESRDNSMPFGTRN